MSEQANSFTVIGKLYPIFLPLFSLFFFFLILFNDTNDLHHTRTNIVVPDNKYLMINSSHDCENNNKKNGFHDAYTSRLVYNVARTTSKAVE